MILTCKHLLVDIFLTHRLSKSLTFCEFESVNFEPCTIPNVKNRSMKHDFKLRVIFVLKCLKFAY